MNFSDITVGTRITALEKHPTSVQLFRYSAVTWNAHLIHYDETHARSEGYPSILVPSHLHGCFLVQAVLDWAGPHARLRRFRWQNKQLAVAGDVLTCTGEVTAVRSGDGVAIAECELEERNQKGEVCAPGWAVVELPLSSRTE
ncbi:MAG: FAS1-like dehydratase domain-containing protein [Actinophytocola sp.]|uniref:FAS1-like dehydratase domain-containing protein n=1 Tax=Actinophytocola sp. TaxID=1872138 RepID=UPI003D6ABDC9